MSDMSERNMNETSKGYDPVAQGSCLQQQHTQRVYPDLEWYTTISAQKGVSPRCPYAAAARCPRYFESLSLLGIAAGSTRIDPDEDRRLEAFWKGTDLWPLTAEQATSVAGAPDGQKMFSKFCPEVAFLRFGLFATDLAPYPDIEDKERFTASFGCLGQKDWRQDWWHVRELHYSDCPYYSLLPRTLHTATPTGSSEELIEIKPSVAGVRVNIKVLLTRLAKWWLKK